MGGPELVIFDSSGVGLGALFGLILSLPIALFLAFWISAVRNRAVVVLGAFIGAFLAFLVIDGWAGELIYDSVLPGASGGSAFFGALLLCSAGGLAFGMLFDVIVGRMTAREYRRQAVVHE